MIYFLSCDRIRFAEIIANQSLLSETEVASTDTLNSISLSEDDILLIWQESPAGKFKLPRAVLVAEESMADFLAWVSTYFRHIRPFTAHCRVLTPSLAQLFTPPTSPISVPDIGSADIGLILAEGITYSIGRTDLDHLPPSALARTLSFAFAEATKRFERMRSDTGEMLEQIKSANTVKKNYTDEDIARLLMKFEKDF